MVPRDGTVRTRNLISFAILGVLNNLVFALSNASAGGVLPGAIGLVYIINTAPGLLIKIIAPLWITLGSYDFKISLIGLSLAVNLCVLLIPGVPTWLALLGQCAFIGAFSLGAGPCSMMVASELFPLQVRGFALGVATLVNRATSGTIALTFLSLSAAITPAGAYCLFAALAIVACAFTARCVPETKGKSLEEIEREAAERHVASAALVGRAGVELSGGVAEGV